MSMALLRACMASLLACSSDCTLHGSSLALPCCPERTPVMHLSYPEVKSPIRGCQVFYMPIVRHLYYWLGGRPAGKATVRAILARNAACVLIPGGVAEVTEIQHGSEVAFMKSRLGFVKLALESGTACLLYYWLLAAGCSSSRRGRDLCARGHCKCHPHRGRVRPSDLMSWPVHTGACCCSRRCYCCVYRCLHLSCMLMC